MINSIVKNAPMENIIYELGLKKAHKKTGNKNKIIVSRFKFL